MNKSLLTLLVLAAVILFVSPGIVGRLAEKQVEENAQWAYEDNADFTLTSESFDRGWFSSVGRHRLVIKDAELRGLLADDATGEPPSIIIETRVDHGIVPFTSLSGDDGSLKPGLARTISTMELDPGNGEVVALPGKVFSEIGLGGKTSGRYLLGNGSFENAEVAVEWTGADIEFLLNPAEAFVSASGDIQPFSMKSDDESIDVGAIAFSGDQTRTRFGFNTGSVTVEMGEVSVRDRQGMARGVGSMKMDAEVSLDGERVQGHSAMELGVLPIPGFGDVDLTMDVVASGIDAPSLGRITRAVQEAQASTGAADPDMNVLYPAIEADLQRLLAAGMEVRFDQFDISVPQGDIRSKISMTLPESDAGTDFSWPALLLALDAAADITVPAALVEMAQTMNPQAGGIVQMGLLKQNGDQYEMQAEFASGLLTVNGIPMPLPMPGQ